MGADTINTGKTAPLLHVGLAHRHSSERAAHSSCTDVSQHEVGEVIKTQDLPQPVMPAAPRNAFNAKIRFAG